MSTKQKKPIFSIKREKAIYKQFGFLLSDLRNSQTEEEIIITAQLCIGCIPFSGANTKLVIRDKLKHLIERPTDGNRNFVAKMLKEVQQQALYHFLDHQLVKDVEDLCSQRRSLEHMDDHQKYHLEVYLGKIQWYLVQDNLLTPERYREEYFPLLRKILE